MWAKAYHLTFLCDFRKTDPMGSHLGGVAHVSSLIEADRSSRDTGLYKPHISGLSDLAASVPSCHGVNTSELASVLPREVRSDEERYRYIGRPLSDPRIDPFSVMGGQVPEVVDKLSSNGQTVVLMMGQSTEILSGVKFRGPYFPSAPANGRAPLGGQGSAQVNSGQTAQYKSMQRKEASI